MRSGEEVKYDSSSRRSLLVALGVMWRSRSLLWVFTYQELTLRYRRSIAGFLWSLATPLVSLIVYSFALSKIIRISLPDFAVFVWSGLVVWNCVVSSMTTATTSVIRSWGLVSKVDFPRQDLPIAAVLASFVNLGIQLLLIFVVAVLAKRPIGYSQLPLLIIATSSLLFVLAGVGLITSAINVYVRDTQYIIDVALIALFWLTPIIYSIEGTGFGDGFKLILNANPLTPIVLTFQHVLYGNAQVGSSTLLPSWSITEILASLSYPLAFGLTIFGIGLYTFNRLQLKFADEL